MDDKLCATIEGWFPPPHGLAEIKNTYGDIVLKETKPNQYVISSPAHWENNHMASATIPGYPKKVYMHNLMAPMAIEAFRQCVALGDGYQITKLGCFNPRTKRSQPRSPSCHSWGIAFDLNPDTNKAFRIKTVEDLARKSTDIPQTWINVFKSIGFTWGGDFSSYYDPMHFQYCSGY
jgi:hypothetical protein